MRRDKISSHLVLEWSAVLKRVLSCWVHDALSGVHPVWPKSGSLLSYGLKGVLVAMVDGLARFLMACNGGK